jgi:regulator of PEP synthase PpsR (kinase-PPPase family)
MTSAHDTGPVGPVYIVSGGSGHSGTQVVNTLLAQFPDSRLRLVTITQVRSAVQLEQVVAKAAAQQGLIVHTMVDESLRKQLVRLSEENRVPTVDLFGDLISRLTALTGKKPLGQPGLYQNLRRSYFKRIDAIEFSMSHDDGMRPGELRLADIVLVGVSRAGKTPLSMYLAVQGWKVANVPLVTGIEPPPELFEIDHRRVVGLSIEAELLIYHRHRRQSELGLTRKSSYDDLDEVFDEVEEARRFFRRHKFHIIGVAHKPIETIADQIVRLITERFGPQAQST